MPTVAAITPADGAVAVPGNTPVRVELTRADSTDSTKVETSQADFAAGTLVQTTARATGDLALAPASSATPCLALDGSDNALVSFPSNPLTATDNFTIEVVLSPQALGRLQVIVDVGNTSSNGYYIQIDASNSLGVAVAGVLVCVSDYVVTSGEILRVIVKRISGVMHMWVNGIERSLTNNTSAPSTPDSTFQIGWTAGYSMQGKLDEVRLWNIVTANTDITSEVTGSESGLVGAWHCNEGSGSSIEDATSGGRTGTLQSGVSWTTIDAGIGSGSGYAAAGSRVSPAYPLSAVGKFGTGRVEYDATLPTGTSLALSIGPDGSTWTPVATGDRIALWAEGADLAAADIHVKAELATSDSAVTPVLAEVRLVFLPIDPDLVEIDVNGVACTLANGGLAAVGKTAKVTAGPVIVDPCHQDITVATLLPWYDMTGPVAITVLVKYAGATISTTTFTLEQVEQDGVSGITAWWLPRTLGGEYDGHLSADAWFFVSHLEDYLFRGDAHWYVQFGPVTTFDAYYLIAHAFRCDTPVAAILGQPVTHDVPASGVGNCWARCDTPAAAVAQCWLRGDDAVSGIVAVEMAPHDEALAGIVGLPLAADAAAAGVVYEVNRNNAIDLRVISVEEAALLDALGLLRQ